MKTISVLKRKEDKRVYDIDNHIALYCCNTLQYYSNVNSAKLYLRETDFIRLMIKPGYIIHLRLNDSLGFNENIELLCTAWPRLPNDNCEENAIIFDNSVIINSRDNSKKLIQSVNATITILSVSSPTISRSIKMKTISSNNDTFSLHSSLFSGLPICYNALIHSKDVIGATNTLRGNALFQVKQINSDENKYFIVSSHTIISQDNSPVRRINVSEQNAFCKTLVVKELMDVLVYPLLFPDIASRMTMLTSGILLLGPPGTGKTYSIKALQYFSRNICQVEVVEINIPQLISSDDPISMLDSILNAIPTENLAISHSIRKQSSISTAGNSPVTPSTPSTPSNSKEKFSFRNLNLKSPNSIATNKLDSNTPSSSPIKRLNKVPVLYIIAIDEIDALGDSSTKNEIQIAIKLYICNWFDCQMLKKDMVYSCMIATSNRSQDIDSRLRRGGRFEREIQVIGNKHDREALLKQLLSSSFINNDSCEISQVADEVASFTGGYVSADIVALVSKAIEIFNENSNVSPTILSSLLEARSFIQPSCLRGIAIDLPLLLYDDVIGCQEAKKQLKRILSFTNPSIRNLQQRFNVSFRGGAILYGKPGNSKTRLILAAANSHKLPLISLSSADVYSPYVGDAEAEIRKAFSIARQASPCILFFDEIDALVTNRSHQSTSVTNVESRILSTLLNEMDGIGSGNNEVLVFGTTNRLDSIDSALLRKGRFDQLIYIPSPSKLEAIELIDYFAKKCQLSDELVKTIKDKVCLTNCELSGAEIENMCRESKLEQIRCQLLTKMSKIA